MSISKTISTIVITALVGVFTFIFTVPKKVFKIKSASEKTRNEGEDKENLFI